MTTQPQPLMNTNGAVWCVRIPGQPAGTFVHPEGACACFHGGPAPVRASAAAPLTADATALGLAA